MINNYRCQYLFKPTDYGTINHNWMLVGHWGGVNLRIDDHTNVKPEFSTKFSGGIEIHYRTPPVYMSQLPPSHDRCWLLKCPCWHDGSSLAVEEIWLPFWNNGTATHDEMFNKLAIQADEYFEPFISGVSHDQPNP